jgi:putative tryptophan/tyrosine transport system substrate-binding protein
MRHLRATSRVSRRQLMRGAGLAGLGLLAGCGRPPFPATAPATQAPKISHIGFLSTATLDGTAELTDAFRQGLADYGYVEGRDITVEWRFAEGSRDRTSVLAAEMVALQLAVIVVAGTPDARVVQSVSPTMPIVVAGTGGDLVDSGLAASDARPGGTVTGLSVPTALRGKAIQLLVEAAPGMSRLAVLADASLPRSATAVPEEVAQQLGIQLHLVQVGSPDELDSAFTAAAASRADGLYVAQGPWVVAHRRKIVTLAAEHRLPAMYGRRVFVDDGGLMSYQPRITDQYRHAAYYVDRILKGANPADLPIEQPMRFDFVLNRRTAQALGLSIPHHVLLQATDIIQ